MIFMRRMERDFNIGFTLIELLVVIVVIAVLIGITVPRMQGMRDEANRIKAQAETRSIGAAVELYAMNQDPDEYPVSTTTICESILNNTKPLIINEVLIDPFSVNVEEYNYIISSNGKYYVVFSVGIDREADITGIDNEGLLQGINDDDIFWTNGKGF